MINIGIVVTERCQASSIFMTIDLLIAANFSAMKYFNAETPLFNYQLIGLKSKQQSYGGNTIGDLVKIQNYDRPDIVILPGAFEAILTCQQSQALLNKMASLFTILQTWHRAGTVVASVCTGNFILASANISVGRTLSCHWASKETASQLFPDESFDTDKILLDHGDVISAGGGMAIAQLVLCLICRFHSRELALAAGKLMMVELNFDEQSRFAIFRPKKDHGDIIVEKFQRQIESSFNLELNMTQFAEQEGIGTRQLSRRFKKATGETPLSYLQRYRVEQVKIGLESTTTAPLDLIWSVGYEDPTSFRRLFKRSTGLTMQEYRGRFSAIL